MPLEFYELSREVQVFAERIGFSQSQAFSTFLEGSEARAAYAHDRSAPREVLRDTLMDALTAFDVMARRRASAQGRQRPTDDDFQVVWTAWCFWPNKPPEPAGLTQVIRRARTGLIGAYLSEAKREGLREAMGELLLYGSVQEVTSFMTSPNSREQLYLPQVINIQRLR